jgi:hypothetical protein
MIDAVTDILVIRESPFAVKQHGVLLVLHRNDFRGRRLIGNRMRAGGDGVMRKLIAFDDDMFDKLTQLGRDRMATLQELADEAFADVLKKHGIPVDLKDALRKSAGLSKVTTPKSAKARTQRKTKS